MPSYHPIRRIDTSKTVLENWGMWPPLQWPIWDTSKGPLPIPIHLPDRSSVVWWQTWFKKYVGRSNVELYICVDCMDFAFDMIFAGISDANISAWLNLDVPLIRSMLKIFLDATVVPSDKISELYT